MMENLIWIIVISAGCGVIMYAFFMWICTKRRRHTGFDSNLIDYIEKRRHGKKTK
jgi:hypothetical protein